MSNHSFDTLADMRLPIIATHHSPLSQKFGTPRQPNLVTVPSLIVMHPPFDTPDAFVGIEAFSHLWVSWQFHHNRTQAGFRPQVRPPRLGGNRKLGVFATRSMYRPSQLGLSVVRLVRVAVQQGRVCLHIAGADMVDGTPIVDIKPYISYSDSLADAVSGFASRPPEPKPVQIHPHAQQQFNHLVDAENCKPSPGTDIDTVTATSAAALTSPMMTMQLLNSDDLSIITKLVAQDPRPAYRQQEIGGEFVMRYKSLDVVFAMDSDGQLWINAIRQI